MLLKRQLKRRFKKFKDMSLSQTAVRDRNQMEKKKWSLMETKNRRVMVTKNRSLMVIKNLRVKATKRMNLRFKENRTAFTASINLTRVMSQNGAITAAVHTTTAQPQTFIMARPALTPSLQTMA